MFLSALCHCLLWGNTLDQSKSCRNWRELAVCLRTACVCVCTYSQQRHTQYDKQPPHRSVLPAEVTQLWSDLMDGSWWVTEPAGFKWSDSSDRAAFSNRSSHRGRTTETKMERLNLLICLGLICVASTLVSPIDIKTNWNTDRNQTCLELLFISVFVIPFCHFYVLEFYITTYFVLLNLFIFCLVDVFVNKAIIIITICKYRSFQNKVWNPTKSENPSNIISIIKESFDFLFLSDTLRNLFSKAAHF